VRACLYRVRVYVEASRRRPSGSGSYMRTRICVFATTGLAGRCWVLLLAVESNRGRSHRSASVGRWSRVGLLRGSGANRDDRLVRFGAQHRAASVERTVIASWWVRVAEQIETCFDPLGVARERGLRTAISMEGAVFGRRIRGSFRRRVGRADFTRERVYRERRGEPLHRVDCESRRPRGGAAKTSERDFGDASESSRTCTVQGNLSWGLRRHGPVCASRASVRGRARAGLRQHRGGFGRSGWRGWLCEHRVGFGRAV